MIRVATGQICFIGEDEVYDKRKDKHKVRLAITTKNVFHPTRIEYIEFDLLNDNINLIDDMQLAVGDFVELQYQDIGRMYSYVDDSGEEQKRFHQNKDCFKITVLNNY